MERREGDSGHRTGRNPHEIRDLFRSQWEKSPAKASISEYLMGHVVDPLDYNKAFRDEWWVVGEHKKALSMLQIMSSTKPFGLIESDEIQDLRRQVEALQAERDQLAADVRRVPELKDRIASLENRVMQMVKDFEKIEDMNKKIEEKFKEA